jgi:hypothetical protein
LKERIEEQNSKITLSGRTNLFYLPNYFRKGKGERKERTKEVMEKVI